MLDNQRAVSHRLSRHIAYSHKALKAEVLNIFRSSVCHLQDEAMIPGLQPRFRIDWSTALRIGIYPTTKLDGRIIVDLNGIYRIGRIIEQPVCIDGDAARSIKHFL